MNNKISILHISDLHRSKGFEITNSALLSSLINDKDRYTTSDNPQIKSPDLIVVSGDIVRGSNMLIGSEIELQSQYDEAIDFLNELTRHFLDGDKSRIIVIPGNHDVDWKYSKESMVKVENTKVFDEKNNFKWEYLQESIHPNSPTRWSWKDLSFYKITNNGIYLKRLEAFSKFYSAFYGSSRTYSLKPAEQIDFFDYPQFNLTVAAFNSCFNNDHLRFVGDIHPDCIAKATLQLREFKKRGRLILGTWHHNTKGGPNESNYMDSTRLKNFINSGIVIGFHGHQHKTEVINEYNDVIEQKKITVFSAGTLCGGPKELPTGSNRQYNLIELESSTENDVIKVTLHVREKSESSSLDNPIWTPGRIDSNNVSYYAFEITNPYQIDISTVLMDIDNLMQKGDYDNAINCLMGMDLSNDFVRKFLIECILQTENHKLAIELFSKPLSHEEIIVVLNSATQLRNKSKIKEILDEISGTEISDPSTKLIINKAKAILNG